MKKVLFDLKSNIKTVLTKLEQTYGVEKWKPEKRPALDSLMKTILSQSTSDWNRDMAWKGLKTKYSTWEEVLLLTQKELAQTIHSAGLANQKSERILNILSWLSKEYGQLNADFICELSTGEAINIFTKLKGIGLKTICVVLAFACGRDIFPVDTHVHRLCGRFGFVSQNASADKTHHLMQELVPEGKCYSFHINLLKHGRQICKAQKPHCGDCTVFDHCKYELKSQRLT